MAINDYVNPMDRGSQGLILDYVGNEQTAGGICRMLSINWIIECAQPGAPAPNEVWHAMKAKGPIYFKQIGQQQIGYVTILNGDGWYQSVVDCLELGSRKARHAKSLAPNDSATDAATLANRIAAGLAASTTKPPLVVIRFTCTGGAHCIAAASYNGKTYIFDPNFGVLIIDPTKHQLLGDAMQDLFTFYHIGTAYVVAVT
ncbi:MAG: YopT-type cysteine protease domain-containing protein [Ferrovibrio sp.]|uniref:YopT-type cysteine protease domain-containing protein n=1 Tax=Ferrovibrio sp. TaxID=1917215 RepID=UPI00391A46F8